MPHRLLVPLGLALLVLGVAATPPVAAADCRHADAAFYTTDTLRLTARLHANPSACTDYYISSAPMADGITPRSAIAATVRNNGAHPMTEIKLNKVADWVAANGKSWFDAGVEIRRRMVTAGYDVSRGDTWALNEVGAPSNNPYAVAVLDDTGDMRAHVRDLVRGLYTGDVGMPPSKGLVFAADPPQLTTGLEQYRAKLQQWLADSAFWTDMDLYVRFWAQEGYADAQLWGVAGASLAERTRHLDDYSLHASRLAQGGPGSTDAAVTFFQHAYTPIGNASYPQPSPPPGGVGFGFTAVPVDQMQEFITAQVYAGRSADRFGFAWVPITAQAPVATFVALLDRLAAAIHDSDTDASLACGSAGEFCDADVSGAWFNEAWTAFSDWSPVTNTPAGSNVQVGVVTFATVTSRGSTSAVAVAPPVPPAGFQSLAGGNAYDVETTAAYTGSVEVCLGYDAGAFEGYAPHVFQLVDGAWNDVTGGVDAAVACGTASSLGTFAVFAADPTPPVIVPHVEGPLGANEWYTGDVSVTWDVTDPQSPIASTTGCDPTTIDADTAGTTLTCSATSDGGPAADSVTVKRDATPPTATCAATPSTLWPPNGKLVPVSVDVSEADATSGAAGFVLTAAPSDDAAGFEAGTPDVSGLLRAQRSGNGGDRVYTLTYTARDAAGNTATCEATVTVPHDEGA